VSANKTPQFFICSCAKQFASQQALNNHTDSTRHMQNAELVSLLKRLDYFGAPTSASRLAHSLLHGDGDKVEEKTSKSSFFHFLAKVTAVLHGEEEKGNVLCSVNKRGKKVWSCTKKFEIEQHSNAAGKVDLCPQKNSLASNKNVQEKQKLTGKRFAWPVNPKEVLPKTQCDCGKEDQLVEGQHICRYFGSYDCRCGNQWESGYSWYGQTQKCLKCKRRNAPVKIEKLQKPSESEEYYIEGPHMRKFCSMCKMLGADCSRAERW